MKGRLRHAKPHKLRRCVLLKGKADDPKSDPSLRALIGMPSAKCADVRDR